MTSDSNGHIKVGELNDEDWDRWSENLFLPKMFKPMKKPLTAPLDVAVSDSDVGKLKAGFRPRNMDDKYAFLIEDDNGNISIHCTRYYTGEEVYILHLAPKSDNDNGASAKIHSITWEGDLNGIHRELEQAKKNVVFQARSTLKCDFEALPRYTKDELN